MFKRKKEIGGLLYKLTKTKKNKTNQKEFKVIENFKFEVHT